MRWTSSLGLAAAIGWCSVPGAAMATGYSTDIELLTPDLSTASIPGVPLAGGVRPGAVRVGVVGQYTMNPLTLYEFDQEVGSVIANRATFWLGGSVDVHRNVSLRLALPMVYDWGSDVPKLAVGGFGVGDVRAGVAWAVLRRSVFTLGLNGEIIVPSGRKGAYVGERSVRGNAGILASVELGRVDIGTEIGANLRGSVQTTEEFTLGPELVWDTGARVHLIPEKLAVSASALSRWGFAHLGGAGESALETLLDVEVRAVPSMRFDVGVGRGFTRGYGTTDLRAYLGVTWERIPPLPPGAELPEDAQGPPPPNPLNFIVNPLDQDLEVPEGPAINWEDGELARIDKERIIIRDNIQFQVDTDVILPESRPTLKYVADLLNGNALIGHVVIEGHASEEGSFEHNYTLSKSRAESIFRALLELGVHPLRLSYRGFGEIFPAATGDDEAHLQVNRRVEFHIIRQYEDWEVMPEYQTDLPLPWNGEEHEFVRPSLPDPDRTTPLEIQFERQERGEDPFQGSGFEPAPEDDFELDTPPTAPSTPPGSETPDSEETP